MHIIELYSVNAVAQLQSFSHSQTVSVALPSNACSTLIPLMSTVQSAGHTPMPIIPARRLTDGAEFDKIVAYMHAQQLRELMIVGGNDASCTQYQDSIGLLIHLFKTNPLPFDHIYFAAHPEGTHDATAIDLIGVMKEKEDMCHAAHIQPRFVTQLCLSAPVMAAWLAQVRAAGIVSDILIGLSTSCEKIQMEERLQFCFNTRKGRLIESYTVMEHMDGPFSPRSFIHELQHRCELQTLGIAGYYWYGFNAPQQIPEDIASLAN